MMSASLPPSHLDKRSFVGATAGGEIPRYFLYGDRSDSGSWFINVEPLSKRWRDHLIAPHSHPHFIQIILVTSGRGTMLADQMERGFEGPAALIVPAHTVHGFRYDPDTDGWVLTVTETYLRTLAARAPEFEAVWRAPAALSLADTGVTFTRIGEALRRLDEELEAPAPGAVMAAEAHLITVLVALLRQQGATAAGEAKTPCGHIALVTQFKDLVEQRYRDGWALARFATEMRVSVAALRTACATVLGAPPMKLVHDRLLLEAKRHLIYSDLPVAQIAYLLGFEDPSYFSRFFTRQCGERPTAFRLGQQGNPERGSPHPPLLSAPQRAT